MTANIVFVLVFECGARMIRTGFFQSRWFFTAWRGLKTRKGPKALPFGGLWGWECTESRNGWRLGAKDTGVACNRGRLCDLLHNNARSSLVCPQGLR
jgi:hypothetical protein